MAFFLYFHLEFSFWMSEQFYSLRYRWCKLQHIARHTGALKMMEVGTWPRIRNLGVWEGTRQMSPARAAPTLEWIWLKWCLSSKLVVSWWPILYELPGSQQFHYYYLMLKFVFFSKGWYYNIFIFTYEMYGSGLFPRRQPLYFFSRYGFQNVFGPVACGGRRHVHHIVWYVMIN